MKIVNNESSTSSDKVKRLIFILLNESSISSDTNTRLVFHLLNESSEQRKSSNTLIGLDWSFDMMIEIITELTLLVDTKMTLMMKDYDLQLWQCMVYVIYSVPRIVRLIESRADC